MATMDKDKCDIMEDAMRQIGWSPGSEIPMASEANLKLIEELRDLMVKKTEVTDELEDTNTTLEKLHRHCQNAENSIASNLELLQAYQSEWRGEAHMNKVAERAASKLNQEIKAHVKEISNCKRHMENTEKELCKRKKNIDQRMNRIQWAKTALLEWREAIAQGQKGFELLQKYSKDDDIRARQQDLKRQSLLVDIAKYRQELVNLYDEQKSLEQNLERTANMYRTAHVERRQMVETWKLAVQQMTQREVDIFNAEKNLVALRRQAKEKAGQRQLYDNKLNHIIANNRQEEETIEELNSTTSDIKRELQQAQETIQLRTVEIDSLQKELLNLANRVHQQRAENRQNAIERGEKADQLEKFDGILSNLQGRLKKMENQNLNATQRLKILEDLIDNESKSHKQISKEIQNTNDLLFRTQQKLVEFKDEYKMIMINNDGIRVTIQSVGKKTRDMEKELQRQTEIHYNLGFKCLEYERKIIKQTGGVVDPEVEERNVKYLAQLEEYNMAISKRLTVTEAQNKKLDDNMRTLTTVYNNDNKQLEIMQFDIKEAQVYCEGGIKRLKSETNKNQMLIVELSILKLRVREFENDIAKCNESVYSLEQHRAHLQRTVKDRIVEVKSQLELLYQKRKHLQEERSVMRADIGERNAKIEAVRARFELTKKLLGTNEDGSLVTATQLRVETAQEKQLLLDEGNELNERVIKAEKEIKALENTLKLFTCSNENYRRSVQSKDEADATEELKSLNDSFCKTICMLKTVRSKYMQLETSIEKLMEEKEMLEEEVQNCKKNLENSNEELEKFKKELDNQKLKLERADRELRRYIRTSRQAGLFTDEQYELQERELNMREQEKRNLDTLNQLSDWAENDNVIGPEIIARVLTRGLQLPRSMKGRSRTSIQSVSSAKSLGGSSRHSSTSINSVTCCHVSVSRVSLLSVEFPQDKM